MKNNGIWKQNQFYIKGNYNFYNCERLTWNGKRWVVPVAVKIFDEFDNKINTSLMKLSSGALNNKREIVVTNGFNTQISYKEYKYPEYWNKLYRSMIKKNKYELIIKE